MFQFIKNKLKFSKICKIQFRQQIIFVALDGGKYILGDENWDVKPKKARNFNVNFEVLDNAKVLKVIFLIDEQKYSFCVDTREECGTYFMNFLEAFHCFNNWESLVYVSSTDKPKDYLCITNSQPSEPDFLRLIMLINDNDNTEIIDTYIDIKLFISEFIIPLTECEPFKQYIEQAQLLLKYSPKKVKMPLY